MGTNYNIIPKQYNGSDYDVLRFKDISQQILINDTSLTDKFNLSSDANIKDLLQKATEFEIVNYVGTGLSGSSNPCSLTFSFVPTIIMYVSNSKLNNNEFETDSPSGYIHSSSIVLPSLYTTSYSTGGFYQGTKHDYYNNYGCIANSGKTFQWYSVYIDDPSTTAAKMQYNEQNITYYFIGILI